LLSKAAIYFAKEPYFIDGLLKFHQE